VGCFPGKISHETIQQTLVRQDIRVAQSETDDSFEVIAGWPFGPIRSVPEKPQENSLEIPSDARASVAVGRYEVKEDIQRIVWINSPDFLKDDPRGGREHNGGLVVEAEGHRARAGTLGRKSPLKNAGNAELMFGVDFWIRGKEISDEGRTFIDDGLKEIRMQKNSRKAEVRIRRKVGNQLRLVRLGRSEHRTSAAMPN
jgi:hypothetical protein